MRRARKAAFIAVTCLGSLALCLLAFEIGLRLVGFEFHLYPKLQFGWPDPVTLEERYRADPQLLWVTRDYSRKLAEWTDRRPSIVYMGDSCTETGIYDELIGVILEKEYPDRDITWVNVGVGGWSSYQGLMQLKRDVAPLRPRLVTIYYGWNDHWSSFGIEDSQIGRFNRERPALLAQLSGLRVTQWIDRAMFRVRYSNGESRGRKPPYRVPLAEFDANLTLMVRLSRQHGITPVLITAPSSHRRGEEPAYLGARLLANLSDLVPLHERYVQAVRAVANRERAALIDLYAEFRRMPPGDLERFFFEDGIHLTEEGNRKMAEIAYRHLKQSGLIDLVAGDEGPG